MDTGFKRSAKARLMQNIRPKRSYIYRHGFAFLTALGLLLIAGGSTILAAQYSTPGSPLYPVKIVTENVALSVTPEKYKPELEKIISERRKKEDLVKENKKVNQKTDNKPGAKTDVIQKTDDVINIPKNIVEEKTEETQEIINEVVKDAPEIIKTPMVPPPIPTVTK